MSAYDSEIRAEPLLAGYWPSPGSAPGPVPLATATAGDGLEVPGSKALDGGGALELEIWVRAHAGEGAVHLLREDAYSIELLADGGLLGSVTTSEGSFAARSRPGMVRGRGEWSILGLALDGGRLEVLLNSIPCARALAPGRVRSGADLRIAVGEDHHLHCRAAVYGTALGRDRRLAHWLAGNRREPAP